MNLSNLKLSIIVILFLSFTIASTTIAQDCNVKITSPSNGSQTDGNGLVSGTVNLPQNGHLWILSHKVGFTGWWPQGNGAAQIIGNEWDVLVYYGIPNDYGKFEVIALIVDGETHADLEKWVRDAPINNYPPIALPTSIGGCEFARIRVNKTKN